MTDYNLFKAAVCAQGYSFERLAKEIGITPVSLSYKANNKRAFTAPEISEISKILHLSIEDREKIFFSIK